MADRFDDIEEFDSWVQGSDDEGGEEGALDEDIARLSEEKVIRCYK